MIEGAKQLDEQSETELVSSSKKWTIFTSMVDAVNEKEQRRLRFAKCSGCNRVNPYRLINVEKTASEIQCHACGTKISIERMHPFQRVENQEKLERLRY